VRIGCARRHRRGPVTEGVLAILLLTQARSALGTDGLEPIGVSLESRARGGADVAVGDSALSQIDNPATLTLSEARTCQFDVAEEFVISRTRWIGRIDSAESERPVGLLSNVGLTMPLDRDLSMGLALHWKAGLGSRFHTRNLMMPLITRRVGSEFAVVDPQLNVAYKLTEKMSVGAGVRIEAATAEMSAVLGPLDVDLGRGYACGGGFQLGWHYQVRRDLAVGLAYRSPTWFGDMPMPHAGASLYGWMPVYLKDAEVEDFRLPQRITAGAAWDVTERLKLVGEARWIDASDATCGSTTVAANVPTRLQIPFPLGYRDQWVFIGGAEFKLDKHWTLGMGYHFATQPVSEQNLLPTGSVIFQHHLTAGLRYELKNGWVGVGYTWALPTSMRNDGRSQIPLGVDYGCSELEQEQHGILVGFGWRW